MGGNPASVRQAARVAGATGAPDGLWHLEPGGSP